MNARHGLTALCAIVILAGAGASLAQEDNVLQRYDLALENLQFAIDSVPGDGVQARDELERAVNALLTLSREATSVNLVQAMEQTFDRARTAVENQSATDLAVQAAVLRGGFRRLVMDSSFTAATAGQVDLARTRLLHLAEDMTFTPAASAELTAAADAAALRLAFEAGVAETVAAELTVANRLLESDRSAAYRSLATAYGDALMIQDSPRADVGLNESLLSAAQALVTGQDEAVATASQTAQAQLSRLAASARAGEPAARPAQSPAAEPAQSSAQSEEPAAAAGSPAALPPVDAPDEAETAANAAAEQPIEQPMPAGQAATPPAAGPSLSVLPGLDAENVGGPEAGVSPSEIASLADEQVLALAAATLQQREREEATAELSERLRAGGLEQDQANTLATSLLDAGFATTDAAVEALGAGVASAIASLRSGDLEAAEVALTGVEQTYNGPLDSLVSARDNVVAADTRALLSSLQDRPALRVHDLNLLASQVDAVDRAINGEPQLSGHAVELALDSYWSGWTRLAVLVILGLLAFVPLRYLNLAFGGGNANWRLVAWALFLLLVPLVYEALAAILSILAELLDQPYLDVLAGWSMFTSTTGQVVWAVLLFLALLLATVGLRGICRQFGLLGGDNGRVGVGAASANPTLVDMTRSTKPSAVDWEDEF